jgi:hypothetical protein
MKAQKSLSRTMRSILFVSAVFFAGLQRGQVAAAPAAAPGRFQCAALLKVKEATLPSWYKTDLKERAKIFFEKLFELKPNAQTGRKIKFDGLTSAQQARADYANTVLKDQKKWREFTISLAIELAERLYQKGLLKEESWYSDQIGILESRDSVPLSTVEFVKEKVNPELRKLLKAKLMRHGFERFTTVKDTLEDRKLMKIFAAGKIFWDDAFLDLSHGSETHAIQTLFLAEELDKKYGSGRGVQFYKLMGTEAGYKIFDEYLDSVNGTLFEPERLNPVLSLVLPQR